MNLKRFIPFLTEVSMYAYDNKVNNNELDFIRRIIGMVNDSNPANKYKTIRTDHPLTIIFGDDTKKFTIKNVIGVLPKGTDVKDGKKADFLFITQGDAPNISVSVKKTNSSTYSKIRTLGDEFKKYLIDKGVDISVPRVYELPVNMQFAAVFGSDINDNGFVFKGDHKHYENLGKHTYQFDGRVITELSDLYPEEMPVLVISNRPPEIVTRNNPGAKKELYKIDKKFLRDYNQENK